MAFRQIHFKQLTLTAGYGFLYLGSIYKSTKGVLPCLICLKSLSGFPMQMVMFTRRFLSHNRQFSNTASKTGGPALSTVMTKPSSMEKSMKFTVATKAVAEGIMASNAGKKRSKDDFDKFAENLKTCEVEYIHPVIEHIWGQRVVRFYDPDKHIIEVGENMKAVCKRFLDCGMTPEQVAERMNVPIKFINACMR